MALVLDFLAREQAPLDEFIKGPPSYAIHKEKVQLDRQQVADAIPEPQQASWTEGATAIPKTGQWSWRTVGCIYAPLAPNQ